MVNHSASSEADDDSLENIFDFLHNNGIDEAILMSTHNIQFRD